MYIVIGASRMVGYNLPNGESVRTYHYGSDHEAGSSRRSFAERKRPQQTGLSGHPPWSRRKRDCTPLRGPSFVELSHGLVPILWTEVFTGSPEILCRHAIFHVFWQNGFRAHWDRGFEWCAYCHTPNSNQIDVMKCSVFQKVGYCSKDYVCCYFLCYDVVLIYNTSNALVWRHKYIWWFRKSLMNTNTHRFFFLLGIVIVAEKVQKHNSLLIHKIIVSVMS